MRQNIRCIKVRMKEHRTKCSKRNGTYVSPVQYIEETGHEINFEIVTLVCRSEHYKKRKFK